MAEDIRLIIRMKLNAAKFHKQYEEHRKKAIADHRKMKMEIYAAKEKGQWKICHELGTKGASPLIVVKRPTIGPNGQPKGTVATNPGEVDEIIRK